MEKIKNIFSTLFTVLLSALMLLTFALIGLRFAGVYALTVLSGSMEPTYPTGSMILVKPVDVDQLVAGDIITYIISDNTLVTHRITGVIPDETDPGIIRFSTKGDANNTEDMFLVHENNVVGTPIFCVPKVGYVINFVKNPPGTYIVIAGASLVVLLAFLPDLFAKDEDEDENEQEKKDSEADADDIAVKSE